jgi:hypothetical protein
MNTDEIILAPLSYDPPTVLINGYIWGPPPKSGTYYVKGRGYLKLNVFMRNTIIYVTNRITNGVLWHSNEKRPFLWNYHRVYSHTLIK